MKERYEILFCEMKFYPSEEQLINQENDNGEW